MHSLVIGAAVVLMGIWLLLLPLRLTMGLRAVLRVRARSVSAERVASSLDAAIDEAE